LPALLQKFEAKLHSSQLYLKKLKRTALQPALLQKFKAKLHSSQLYFKNLKQNCTPASFT